MTLDVLQRLNRHDESVRFFEWVLKLGAAKRLAPVYREDGATPEPERELPWLSGYSHSRPVRVGNLAAGQLQLDAPGHLLDAIDLCFQRMPRAMEPELWAFICQIVDRVVDTWTEPDQSIWEVRGRGAQFLYSKIFAWVALDRALRLASRHGLRADSARWQGARDKIRDYILDAGYSRRLDAFTAVVGRDILDPSVLMLPLVGLIEPHDERMRRTVSAVRRQLEHDGLLHRNAELSTKEQEAAFGICTFWLVDCLALMGEKKEATAAFERLVGHVSELGLLAEEIDTRTGAFAGNFPQAFSHLGLIRSAMRIDALS